MIPLGLRRRRDRGNNSRKFGFRNPRFGNPSFRNLRFRKSSLSNRWFRKSPLQNSKFKHPRSRYPKSNRNRSASRPLPPAPTAKHRSRRCRQPVPECLAAGMRCALFLPPQSRPWGLFHCRASNSGPPSSCFFRSPAEWVKPASWPRSGVLSQLSGSTYCIADTAAGGVLPFYFGAREEKPGLVRTFSPPPSPLAPECDAPVQMLNLQAQPLPADRGEPDPLLESSCTMLAGQAASCSTWLRAAVR